MSRTKNARDLKRRKGRKDKGKKRPKYGGKPVKKKRKIQGRIVPYVSKRKGDLMKVYFLKVDAMSKDGYMNLSPEFRKKAWKYVYGRDGKRKRIDVPEEQLSTIDNIADLCLQILSEGTWHLRLYTHRRNKYHCSAVTVATVNLFQTSEGLQCKVHPSFKNRSLKRYRFWRGK